MRYSELKNKYPKFVYESYSYKISDSTNSPQAGKNLEIFFDFSVGNIQFKPEIVIKNTDVKSLRRIGDRVLDNLVFNLGLMEIPSYWKATCSPVIEVRAGYLDKEQINWWKDLIIKGLGQFYYENKINWRSRNFLKIKCEKGEGYKIFDKKLKKRYLVPIGGGKDSALAVEILRERGEKINGICLSPSETAASIMKIAGFNKPIIAQRKIDKKLLELNRKGFLNGHTPISAYFAFFTVLAAVIFDYKYIALANEKSSNEGNTKYLGRMINHQWSKSSEFEKMFRKYSKKYLAKDVEYFSLLRPLYEIQIAELFSKYPKYFNTFISCNEAYKTVSGTRKPTGKWCGKCPKCLFAFMILYPFLEKKDLIKIFKKNLFEDKKLLPILRQLTGEEGFKPFECVGTKRESKLALKLSLKKTIKTGRIPYLLTKVK